MSSRSKMDLMLESMRTGFDRDVEPLHFEERSDIRDELRDRAGVGNDIAALESKELKRRAQKIVEAMLSLAQDMGIDEDEAVCDLINYTESVFQ